MTKKQPPKAATPHDDTRAKIMELLRAAEGEPITARMLSIKTKTGEVVVWHVAKMMVSAGAIRQAKSSRQTVCYFAPTDRQLAAEEKARQAVVHKPLQPRTAHQEAVERAREVREQYRSIG